MSLTSGPSTSTNCLLNPDDEILFRYTWTLKVKKRFLTTGGEATILNVSPTFCTAYNGVQFSWLIKICDECVLDMDDESNAADRRFVNITLYYKDGPAQEIKLTEAKISVNDENGKRQFSNVSLESLEYIKGSGWHCDEQNSAERIRLSSFVQENIGNTITVIVEIKMKTFWFLPLGYLPEIDARDNKLREECEEVLQQMLDGKLTIPDVDLFDVERDRYAFHRHCFLFGCKEIIRRCQGLAIDEDKVQTVFSSVYCKRVIEEAECFEDFVELLEASFDVHFTYLIKECEKHVCREVMLETTDNAFVKKMLLLAERFNLKVLKMVSFGIIVDRFISGNHTKRGSVEEIRDELLQIAEQIKTSDTEDQDDKDSDGLVQSVIDQLEELAKHIRKVSTSPDSGCPYGVAPVGVSSPGPQMSQGRRSSLKTSREILTFSSSPAATGLSSNSPRDNRRRSAMFSFPNILDENSAGQLKGESRTETSSISSNSLSSRLLHDVFENSLDATENCVERDVFEADDKEASIFTFEEPYSHSVKNGLV